MSELNNPIFNSAMLQLTGKRFIVSGIEPFQTTDPDGVMLRDEADGTWSVIRWQGLAKSSSGDTNPAAAALRLWLEVNGEMA